jgi:hypothetical protein
MTALKSKRALAVLAIGAALLAAPVAASAHKLPPAPVTAPAESPFGGVYQATRPQPTDTVRDHRTPPKVTDHRKRVDHRTPPEPVTQGGVTVTDKPRPVIPPIVFPYTAGGGGAPPITVPTRRAD